MRNKKGDLLNNVLTTIIAVIGLALLAYAAWRLYSVYVNQDEKNAQATIKITDSKINAIEDGQIARFAVRGIKGWFIAAWSKDDSKKPSKCSLSSCICICRVGGTVIGVSNANGFYFYRDFPKDCQANGFCRAYDVLQVEAFNLFNRENKPAISREYFDDFLKNPDIEANSQYATFFLKDYAYNVNSGKSYISPDQKFSGLNPILHAGAIYFGEANLNEVVVYKEKDMIRMAVLSQTLAYTT